MATYDPRTIAIGVLGKPHGVHGEIGLRLFNLESIAPLEPGPVVLERNGKSTAHTVTHTRPFGAGLLLTIAGIDSREAAAALTHSHVRVERASLPAPARQNVSLATHEPSPASRANGKRILIADDNVDFAASLEAILVPLGHDVRVVHDGDAAQQLAARFEPQIAFLDIGLPGRDGYDVARSLRAASATAQCRLVAITGWGQDDDRRRSRDAGFDMHLVKPVDPSQLVDIVDAGTPARVPV